jgi:hypothetical protein
MAADSTDITKLSWPMNVALAATVFSVFALIYNIGFIYYGFVTFIYGIAAHLVDMIGSNWFKNSKVVYISQIIFTLLWIVILLYIYR